MTEPMTRSLMSRLSIVDMKAYKLAQAARAAEASRRWYEACHDTIAAEGGAPEPVRPFDAFSTRFGDEDHDG